MIVVDNKVFNAIQKQIKSHFIDELTNKGGVRIMRRKYPSQEGAALVEFVIVLPVILLLLFGMIEFGILMYNKQVITNASREGARYAIVYQPSGASYDPQAVKDVVNTYCSQNLLISFGSNNHAVPDEITVTDVGNNDIQVEVTYEYQFLIFDGIVQLLNGNQNPITSSGRTIMRSEHSPS